MSTIVDRHTRVLVQGITGRAGGHHTAEMLEYGTNIVAGVSPGKGGGKVHGVPVFESVEEAINAVGEITASVLFVPAAFVKDAAFEAMAGGIKVIVIITEHVPLHDEMLITAYARAHGHVIIGPNCPGIASPSERVNIGIIPRIVLKPGSVGVVSRSGTLTYEIAHSIVKEGLGESTLIGMGGDRITGLDFVSCLSMFEMDSETRAVVLVGEIGGTGEERAAEYIKEGMSKPVVSFIAGRHAPQGKRFGHAGAIVNGRSGLASEKMTALKRAGAVVANDPGDVGSIIKEIL